MKFSIKRGIGIVLTIIAFGLYATSLFMPLMIVEQLLIFSDRVTFLGVIRGLAQSREWLLCALIVIATVVLPITKFVLLGWQLVATQASRQGNRAYQWLMQLSRWSMLDVFVVAVFIVMLKTSFLSNARTETGFYLFVSSILLVAVVSFLIERKPKV